jgi:hypothetical protein
MLCEIKHMVKNLPRKEIKPEIKPNNNFPCLALDISCAFGGTGIPIKSHRDILKANLVQVDDKEFLERIAINEIEGEDKVNPDFLVTNKWVIKNESDEVWPSDQESIVLKCLSNDSFIKLKDLKITEKEMTPQVLNPGETSELKIEFLLPHRIKLAAEKNRKTINIIFSLYDESSKKYFGANLPCTIPL